MQHDWSTKYEDLEVVELLRSISRSQEVPTEACLQKSPSPISCQMCLVCGGKGTISSLHMTVVGVGWYSYFDSKAWNGSMNLKNYIG